MSTHRHETDSDLRQKTAGLEQELRASLAERDELVERQTATAEILKVIASSPSDVRPVFDAILANADRLIGGYSTGVYRFVDDIVHLEAFTPVNPVADEVLKARFPRPVAGIWHFERAHAGETVEIADTEAEAEDLPLREIARARGFRSVLYSPLMSKGKAIGVIVVSRRNPGSFSPHHVELLRTFADQAVIAIENARLFNEVQVKTADLSESLQQQTATADVLKVISRSAFDLQNILDTLIESAALLCTAERATLFHQKGKTYVRTAFHGFPSEAVAEMKNVAVDLNSGAITSRALRQCAVVHVADVNVDPDYPKRTPAQILGGIRTVLSVPLVREGRPIGAITLARTRVDLFTPKQIDLIRTFADQAVIAIENVRLFNETQEALERQTATADILKVIAGSPSNVQPVFEAIVANADRLVGGFSTAVYRFVGSMVHLSAFTPIDPASDEILKSRFPHPIADRPYLARAQAGETIEIPDTEIQPDVALLEIARVRGIRSLLYSPLMSKGTAIGVIVVTRRNTGSFSAHHVELLRTFSDQAVIAIENVRLFNETQEALERQTATADILKVIASSPSDVQPVFEAIAERSNRLIEGLSTAVYSIVDDALHLMAFTRTNPEADAALQASFPRPLSSASWGERVRNGESVQISDFDATVEAVENAELREMARLRGFRSLLFVPLRRDGRTIGMIGVSRPEPGAFAPNHVQLLQTFADQAVIAIGNVRLFDEVQARTRDLTESLEQQTATSEVLEVISASTGELEPVFQKMLENATRICGAHFGAMTLYDGNNFRNVARYNAPPAFADAPRTFQFHPQSGPRIAVRTRQVVHVEDIRRRAPYLEGDPAAVALADLAGARTFVAVPLLRENEPVGVITIYRQEVRPFTEKQIDLVANFAKQAVIAIENTRLLKELRERTDDLSTSLDELRTAQDRLVQTEKLASLGQLTAGIAHEIKNPLNFVNNFSALSVELIGELNDVLKPAVLTEKMRGEVDELTKLLKENLEKVVQHGKRADSIVKNMLLHSREGSGEHRSADINALLDESLNLAYHGARAEKPGFNITLQRDFAADAGEIELFPQEITRAFLNMISNGFYAATRRKTEEGDAGFEPVLRATTKNLGSTVEIRIRDNGVGIPADVREKMFNPFFTTKPAGEGTGLGLSMCHDIIVKQHGGRIDVETEPGRFTEFTIVLPRTSNPAKRI